MRLRHLALVVVLFMGAGPGVAGAGGLPEFCSPVLSGVTCIYDSSRVGDNPVHFDALVDALNTYLNALTPPQEITGADGVVIEAWGGQGGAGRNGSTFQFCSGGHRGDPGYARTARQVSDVSAVLTDGKLYILVGKKGADQGGQGGEGGAGSLVLRKPYMDIDDVTDPVGEGVYVIAGGGGGAGGCDDLTLDGSAGGVGGVAVANLFNIAVTASGGDSPEPCFFSEVAAPVLNTAGAATGISPAAGVLRTRAILFPMGRTGSAAGAAPSMVNGPHGLARISVRFTDAVELVGWTLFLKKPTS